MYRKKVRCKFCFRLFYPDVRCKNPIACTKSKCQRKRKRASHKKWRDSNPEVVADRCALSRSWFAKRPDFWQNCRRKNPDKVNCNREKQQERRKCRRVAKSIPKSAYAFEKQKEIFQLVPVGKDVAKSIPIFVQRVEI